MAAILHDFGLAHPKLVITKATHSPSLHFHPVHCSPVRLPGNIKLNVSPFNEQNPAMQQKIIIPNTSGEKLVGILHDTGSRVITVVCHGFRSTKDTSTLINLATSLESEGISSFRFDFAGNGESEGSFQYGNYRREAEDLRAVVEHFTGAGRVVSAILGHSKGGNVVLLYASKYHDIATVVNLSGRFKLNEGVKERLGEDALERIKKEGFVEVKKTTGEVDYSVTEESLMERLNTKMGEACLQIDEKCRVLTVHGSADNIVPVQDAIEFSKVIKNHQLHIIRGANHSFTSHQAELAKIVAAFVKEGSQ